MAERQEPLPGLEREDRTVRLYERLTGLLFGESLGVALLLLLRPSGRRLAALALLLFVLLLVCDGARERARRLWSFALLHALPVAGVWVFLGRGPERLILAFVLALFSVLDFTSRIREESVFAPTYPFLLYGLFLCLLGAGLHRIDVSRVGYVTEALSAYMSLLYYNTLRLREGLYNADRKGSVPLERIRATNRVMVGFYGAAATVLVVISTLMGFGEEAAELLRRGMTALLRGIVLLIAWLLSLLPDREEESGGGPMGPPSLEGLMEQAEEHPLLQKILDALYWLMTAAAIALILWGLFRLLRELYRRFLNARIHDADVAEEISRRDVRERIRPGRPGERREAAGPAKSIRKRYKRLLLKAGGGRNLRRSMTPAELEEAALGAAGAGSPQRERLHLLYEKARYLPERVTREDAAAMKEAARACE